MLAVSGIRNGRSFDGKVALVLHGIVGLPQIVPCLAGLRFCADVVPAEKLSVALAISMIAGTRSRVQVLSRLIILNRKCFLRRVWDSNPRNGFPLTAFP